MSIRLTKQQTVTAGMLLEDVTAHTPDQEQQIDALWHRLRTIGRPTLDASEAALLVDALERREDWTAGMERLAEALS